MKHLDYWRLANAYERIAHTFAKEGAWESVGFYREVARRCLAYTLQVAA